ncbi:MAG: FAD-dependent oxidoreductase [Deltaproteobacteria bacterium]|nr:FAD-dependent oxidoreductase [Deltaproteobacteria bacterium]
MGGHIRSTIHRRGTDRLGQPPALRSVAPLHPPPLRTAEDLPRNRVRRTPAPSASDRGQPLLTVRSQKTCGLHQLDPDRMVVNQAELIARAGPSGAQIWALATPKLRHGGLKRPLTLAAVYERAARAIFGKAADQRIRYRSLELKLEQHGLQAELQPILASLPRVALARLRSGALTPSALFRARAEALASWRKSPGPMSRSQLERALLAESGSTRAMAWLQEASPEVQDNLQSGTLSAQAVAAVLDDHGSRRAQLGIIGAGMAGIAAANVALEAGKSVVILEAKDRALGRVHHQDVGGLPFDLGGAWIHNRHENPLTRLAIDLGYQLIANDKFHFAVQDGRPSAEAAQILGEKIEALATEWATPGPDDHRPLSERVHGTGELDRLAAEVLGPLEVARELSQLSAAGQKHLVVEKDDVLVKGGLGRMLSVLAVGLPIRTNTPVERIEWGDDEVRVWAQGQRYTFEQLLITLSPAVLSSGAITFDPPLPKKVVEALAGFGMANFEKILLRFERDVFPVEGDNVRGVGFDPEGRGFEVILRVLGSQQAAVLVGGQNAERLSAESDEVALAYGLTQLARLFGEEVEQAYLGGHRTNWSQDPNTLGSYAVPTVDAPDDAVERLKMPLGGQLHFAGEHLAPSGWRASIPGALESGKETVRKILAT